MPTDPRHAPAMEQVLDLERIKNGKQPIGRATRRKLVREIERLRSLLASSTTPQPGELHALRLAILGGDELQAATWTPEAVLLLAKAHRQDSELLDRKDESVATTPQPTDWRDIATAPKDGTLIRIYEADREGGETVARWIDTYDENGWRDRDEFVCSPTHWMPLPAPPGTAASRPQLTEPVKHKVCGAVVETAVLNDDVAIYVWCPTCRDLVEDGDLDGSSDGNRLFNGPSTAPPTEKEAEDIHDNRQRRLDAAASRPEPREGEPS